MLIVIGEKGDISPNSEDRYPVISTNWACSIYQTIMTLEISDSRIPANKFSVP